MSAAGLVLILAVLVQVRGHGMLMDPVNRASMWRLGYPTPKDYNDNQLFCGGRSVQWMLNGGECGECGDNYANPRPRMHENTTPFGTGVIVEEYEEGAIMTVMVKLTANHNGWFTFKLCPINSPAEMETAECFARHPVMLADGGEEYEIPHKGSGKFYLDLKLPDGLTCDHCVLQWTWKTANSWGVCSDGTGKLGCGPQEHFRTCSDIAIR